MSTITYPPGGGDSPGTTATTVDFRGVTRRFGAVVELDDLDLSIGIGETVALARPERRRHVQRGFVA